MWATMMENTLVKTLGAVAILKGNTLNWKWLEPTVNLGLGELGWDVEVSILRIKSQENKVTYQ